MLADIDADVVALQEVIGAERAQRRDTPKNSARRSAWAGSWRRRGTCAGICSATSCSSRLPIRAPRRNTISRGRRARAALLPARRPRRRAITPLHFYNVHLGTSLLERRHQAVRLAAVVHDRRVAGPKIVLGDFNEWTRGLATRHADRKAAERRPAASTCSSRRTYPGVFPDPAPRSHLLRRRARCEVRERRAAAHDRRSLIASDHLPLVADLRIRF